MKVGDNGVIGDADQLIDDRWRRLATSQMLLHRGNRHLGEKELSAAQFTGAVATEDEAGKPAYSGLDLPGLRSNPVAELLWPAGLTEIVTVVEQQQTCLIQMFAHPGGRVQHGAEPIAGIKCCGHTLLKSEHGLQP